MSHLTFFIELPPYLAQWYRHRCGGSDPILPVRTSYESNIIEEFITKRPADMAPQIAPKPGEVAIAIPSFRGRPPEYYNYMPPKALDLLRESIKVDFEIDMWKCFHRFSNMDKQLKGLIYAFMEKHGIEDTETNYLAISKAYQRKRECYQKQQQRNLEKANQEKP